MEVYDHIRQEIEQVLEDGSWDTPEVHASLEELEEAHRERISFMPPAGHEFTMVDGLVALKKIDNGNKDTR